MRAAVLFNEESSLANERLLEAGARLSSFLEGHSVISHSRYGAAFLERADTVVSGRPCSPEDDYRTRLRRGVLDLLEEGPDLIVTVGGDGLASYVADAVVAGCGERLRPSLLGVAAGTANVGPIVSFTAARIGTLSPEALDAEPVDAVEVLDGDEHTGFAFTDAVLGDSFLATVDGQVCNLSAEQLVKFGRKVRVRPGVRIAAEDFAVTLNGERVPPGFPDPAREIRQIVASSLQFDRLYGRAILGGLCGGGKPVAALGLCDRVVVDSDPETWDWKGFTGIRHLVFSPGDRVSISGLAEDAHIVIDGNPFLRKTGSVSFRCVPGLVRVYTKPKEGRSIP